MPGSTIQEEYGFEVEVVGDLEDGRTVYFTDQEPEFEFVVTNKTDESIAVDLRPYLNFQQSDTEYNAYRAVTIEVDPHDTASYSFCAGILPYQGVTIVGNAARMYRPDSDTTDPVEHRPMSSLNTPIYTCMAYDRDYYKVNYLWPRYAQYFAAVATILVILVGVIQILNL